MNSHIKRRPLGALIILPQGPTWIFDVQVLLFQLGYLDVDLQVMNAL